MLCCASDHNLIYSCLPPISTRADSNCHSITIHHHHLGIYLQISIFFPSLFYPPFLLLFLLVITPPLLLIYISYNVFFIMYFHHGDYQLNGSFVIYYMFSIVDKIETPAFLYLFINDAVSVILTVFIYFIIP